MTDKSDTTLFQRLDERECFARLGTHQVGRLGVVIDQYPMIFPVNFALDGDLVTFRTDPDTKFNAAHYANVTFEVDEVNTIAKTGWSVLILGAVHVVDTENAVERERMLDLDLRPFASGEKSVWVQIVPDRITGREIVSENGGLGFDPRGYL